MRKCRKSEKRKLLRTPRLATQREHTFALLAVQYCAVGTSDTGGVYVFGMVFEIYKGKLLRYQVQDLLGSLAANLTLALLATELLG